MIRHRFIVPLAALLAAATAAAATPADLAAAYAEQARREVSAFVGLSADRGARFFQSMHGNDWSCASCHTANPAATGRHARTGKPIAPLAPAANRERFTDLIVADKWFKRNCNDVLGRVCTAQEKGDVLTFLMQQPAPGGAR